MGNYDGPLNRVELDEAEKMLEQKQRQLAMMESENQEDSYDGENYSPYGIKRK